MSRWDNATWEGFTKQGVTYPPSPCEVLIDDERIVLSYEEDGVRVEYAGRNLGDGHFDLLIGSRLGHSPPDSRRECP